MSDTDEINRAIGRLEGKIDSVLSNQVTDHEDRKEIKQRLRKTERNSAIYGMVSGGVIATALTFLKESVKTIVS